MAEEDKRKYELPEGAALQQDEWGFTLVEVDRPDLWVACSDPRKIPYGLQRKLQQAMVKMQRVSNRPDQYVILPEDDWTVTILDDIVRKVVRRWNLPEFDDVDNPGQVLPLGGDDPFENLPGHWYAVITEEVLRRLSAPSKRPR